MVFTKEIINCQDPKDNYNINREYKVVKVTVAKDTIDYNNILGQAKKLAGLVNSGAANESAFSRDEKRRLVDSFAGLLSEYGWRDFINDNYPDIASFTDFVEASDQVDIQLKKGEKIEVRSSTVRKGVKFAICNSTYNFKNIGPYSNAIKPGEIVKDYYCGVLFETQKDQLLDSDEIVFYLVGSSTWKMMVEIGYDTDLNAWDANSLQPGKYRVIQYKNTLDVDQLMQLIKSTGY